MSIRPNDYFKGRICCICNKDLSIGDHGVRYYEDRIWDRKSYQCSSCYAKYTHNDIIKAMSQISNGKLDRHTSTGMGIIGQWISGKTFNVDDNNIKMNNFNFYVDLSNHSEYGIVEVKTATLNKIRGEWHFTNICRDADNFLFVCMDSNRPWIDVERTYIIPWEDVARRTSVAIVKNPSRIVWYKEFRIDETPFNNIYHSVKIPRFFSPFDLWNGRYSSERANKK